MTRRNKRDFEIELLDELIKDPTRSNKEIANVLDSYRQKVWRKKKELENENIIWGYTAVLDESKKNYVTYIVLLKMKPMSEDLADLIVNRQVKGKIEKQDVRLIDIFYLNGQYDWILMFTAPDHASARKYYESIRRAYDEYLLEKPVMVDVNFSLVREGKTNPRLKDLYEFVPSSEDQKSDR